MDALNEQINKGIQILKQGGVIAFPTDTVYGLGADAFNPKAVERIYEIKKRPRHLPLPLLIDDVEQLAVLAAKPLPEIALFLARRFWPGGLTLVVPKAAEELGSLHPYPTAPFKREVNSPSPSLSRQGRGTIHPHLNPLPSRERNCKECPPSPGGRELEGGG